MQLYNTLSAEERAIMIDDAGKQRLTLSFYAYAQIQIQHNFVWFIPCLGPASGSWSIYVKKELTLSYHCLQIIFML
jgi:hypothetical protein